MGHVSISGTARVVNDPQEKSKRWKEEWERHYSNRDTDYILIQVVPDRLEVLAYNRGVLYDPATGSAQAVEFPGGGS
jgi:general stress protein 26